MLRLSSTGVGMLLGELEQRLMEAVWSLDAPATAREIHESLPRGKDIELITAITVLNRLVKPKGLLKRKKMSDVFHYSPTVPREVFMLDASRHVVERVLALGSDAVTASFVDVLAERDPEQLAELGRLVRKKLREADDK
jgi:predicted transcriptional regulator